MNVSHKDFVRKFPLKPFREPRCRLVDVQGPELHAVGVASEEVHVAVLGKPPPSVLMEQGVLLVDLVEVHLKHRTAVAQLHKAFDVAVEAAIALEVSDNRMIATLVKFPDGASDDVVYGLRIEFHEYEAGAVHGENVACIEFGDEAAVPVAFLPRKQLYLDACLLRGSAEGAEGLQGFGGIYLVAARVKVRGRDHGGDALGVGNLKGLEGLFDGVAAVVDAGEDVAVHVGECWHKYTFWRWRR